MRYPYARKQYLYARQTQDVTNYSVTSAQHCAYTAMPRFGDALPIS